MTTEQLQTLLLQAGIKPTQQRMLILDYLHKNRTHPNSEQIYQDLREAEKGLSRATVYNTVSIFKEKGLIKILDTGDEFAHYDIALDEHGHFQCLDCGRIWNIDLGDLDGPNGYTLPDGFLSVENLVLIKGYCPDCRSKHEPPLKSES